MISVWSLPVSSNSHVFGTILPTENKLLNRLILGSFRLLCLSVDAPHFLNSIFWLLVPAVTHYGHVIAVCFSQGLVGACSGLLVVLMAIHDSLCVVARPRPIWSLQASLVQSRSSVHLPSCLWIHVVCSGCSAQLHTAQIPAETVVAWFTGLCQTSSTDVLHQCCVAWMVRTWCSNGFVAESEESRPTWSSIHVVLDGRLLSLPNLFDALGRLACLGLLYHHCVCLDTTRDGSPLDPVSFLWSSASLHHSEACVWPLTKLSSATFLSGLWSIPFESILIIILLISFEVSKYLSCLQPAASQSTLFTPMRVCLIPKVLINLECCLICCWISAALWLFFAMAVAKLPSAGAMMSAVPICNGSVITFLMKSRCLGATMMM